MMVVTQGDDKTSVCMYVCIEGGTAEEDKSPLPVIAFGSSHQLGDGFCVFAAPDRPDDATCGRYCSRAISSKTRTMGRICGVLICYILVCCRLLCTQGIKLKQTNEAALVEQDLVSSLMDNFNREFVNPDATSEKALSQDTDSASIGSTVVKEGKKLDCKEFTINGKTSCENPNGPGVCCIEGIGIYTTICEHSDHFKNRTTCTNCHSECKRYGTATPSGTVNVLRPVASLVVFFIVNI